MKKTLTLLVLLFTVSLFTIGSSANDPVIGSWEFTTPQAPWEFNKGTFNFMAEEEAFSGAIEFHTGQKIDMQKVEVDGNAVSFDINIGGSIVNADCIVDSSTMTCDLTTMQGPMQITANKVAEEEE